MSDHTIVLIYVIKTFFLYSSVYSYHLFLISSASVRSFIEPIFAWNVPLVSLIFLKSSLVFSIVFLCFFPLFREEGFLTFPCYSLELYIQMGISFLFCFAFSFSSFLVICKASSDNYFAFLLFFFLEMVLITASVQCHEPLSIVLQALCLSDLVPWTCATCNEIDTLISVDANCSSGPAASPDSALKRWNALECIL